MDKKFLNKVVDQIMSETIIDYNKENVYFPFGLFSFHKTRVFTIPFHTTVSLFSNYTYEPLPSFSKHCKDVYGLNDDEVKYIWKEYKQIIKDKING